MAGGSTNAIVPREAMSYILCSFQYEKDKPRTPCILGCFNTFCHQCCVDWEQAKGPQVPCPTCHAVCTVPVEDLQINFALRDLVEAERVSTGQTQLGVFRVHGRYYCQGCNILLCQDCLKSHQKSKLRDCKHPSDTLQTIEEFRQNKQPISKQICQCKEHNEKLNLYCLTCDTPIYYVGASTDHDGHKKSVLSDMANKKKISVFRPSWLSLTHARRSLEYYCPM